MRKLFFSLVFVIMGCFAFSSTEVVDKKDKTTNDDAGVCSITYNLYNDEGEVVHQFTITWYSATANSKSDCLKEAVLQPTV